MPTQYINGEDKLLASFWVTALRERGKVVDCGERKLSERLRFKLYTLAKKVKRRPRDWSAELLEAVGAVSLRIDKGNPQMLIAELKEESEVAELLQDLGLEDLGLSTIGDVTSREVEESAKRMLGLQEAGAFEPRKRVDYSELSSRQRNGVGDGGSGEGEKTGEDAATDSELPGAVSNGGMESWRDCDNAGNGDASEVSLQKVEGVQVGSTTLDFVAAAQTATGGKQNNSEDRTSARELLAGFNEQGAGAKGDEGTAAKVVEAGDTGYVFVEKPAPKPRRYPKVGELIAGRGRVMEVDGVLFLNGIVAEFMPRDAQGGYLRWDWLEEGERKIKLDEYARREGK